MKLMGLVLDRLTTAADGKVAYSEIHLTDYATTGATPQDTEDMVNFTRSLTGVEVGLFFMEQPRGGVKVSFRSRARSTWRGLPSALEAGATGLLREPPSRRRSKKPAVGCSTP